MHLVPDVCFGQHSAALWHVYVIGQTHIRALLNGLRRSTASTLAIQLIWMMDKGWTTLRL